MFSLSSQQQQQQQACSSGGPNLNQLCLASLSSTNPHPPTLSSPCSLAHSRLTLYCTALSYPSPFFFSTPFSAPLTHTCTHTHTHPSSREKSSPAPNSLPCSPSLSFSYFLFCSLSLPLSCSVAPSVPKFLIQIWFIG